MNDETNCVCECADCDQRAEVATKIVIVVDEWISDLSQPLFHGIPANPKMGSSGLYTLRQHSGHYKHGMVVFHS